jgi:hypothetical protein
MKNTKLIIAAILIFVFTGYSLYGGVLGNFVERWDMNSFYSGNLFHMILLFVFFCQSSTIVWTSFLAILMSKPPEDIELER